MIQMLISNQNGKTQWKSSKSINPDLLDKLETLTTINLTKRFESQKKKIQDLKIKTMM